MKRLIFSTLLILVSSLAISAQTAENLCPGISLVSPQGLIQIESSVKLSIKIDEKIDKSKLSYEWTASKGQIIQGEGTSEIVFLVSADESEVINSLISVKIIGLPKDCSNNYFSETVGIAPVFEGDKLWDEFGKASLGDYKARYDNLFLHLINNSNYEELISLEFDKKDSQSYKINLLKEIIKFINFRKYDLTRVTFVISEDNKERTVFNVSPTEKDGLKFIDKYYKYSQTVKGEDLKREINNLFPKK